LGTKVIRKGHHEGGLFFFGGNLDEVNSIFERNGENGRAYFGRKEDSHSLDDIVNLVLAHDVIEFILIF
jgi:hypothetical protein